MREITPQAQTSHKRANLATRHNPAVSTSIYPTRARYPSTPAESNNTLHLLPVGHVSTTIGVGLDHRFRFDTHLRAFPPSETPRRRQESVRLFIKKAFISSPGARGRGHAVCASVAITDAVAISMAASPTSGTRNASRQNVRLDQAPGARLRNYRLWRRRCVDRAGKVEGFRRGIEARVYSECSGT